MRKFEGLNSTLAKACYVHGLYIAVDSYSGKSTLELTLVERPYSDGVVRVIFSDVADFKCSLALGGGWTQVNLFGIREMRDGHERPYVAREIEYDRLSFVCTSAKLLED
jgi:hypothetical protein